MRRLIFLGVFLAASVGVASTEDMQTCDIDQATTSYVPVTSAQPCSFWSYSSGGYVCSSYTHASIPDGYSLNRALSNHDDRIRRLEARIAELERLAQ